MAPSRCLAIIVATFAALVSSAGAHAQDKLKVAIGQINNWENQVATLGMQAGIFQKYGLQLETLATQGAGETLQPIISGSTDIGIGVGTSGAMRAFAQGAPVRALAAGFTGTNDIYWYVRADSPIKSLKDLSENNTINRRPAHDPHYGHVEPDRRWLGRSTARRPGTGCTRAPILPLPPLPR
jgi:NitT/TauT family transport system substrate-binding protein